MITKQCPKCNSTISVQTVNQDIYCGNCGNKIAVKKQKNLLPIIIIIIAVFAIIGIVLTLIGGGVLWKSLHLSDEEEHALRVVEKYQNLLKDPDSLKIRGDILILWYDDEGDTKHYTFFQSSANNSYGASIVSLSCYEGYIYIADLDDFEEDDFDTVEEYIDALKASIAYKRYQLFGDTDGDQIIRAEIVSGKKIAKKMHVDYSD